MQVSRKVLETIVNYRHCMSTDENRIFLCGVAISMSGDQLEIKATDGYCAIRSKHDIKVGSKDIFTGRPTIIISKISIMKIDSYLKDNKNVPLFLLLLNDNNYLDIKCNEHVKFITVYPIERDYPKTDHIFKKPKEEVLVSGVNFNPNLLSQVMKAIAPTKKMQNQLGGLSFKFTGKFIQLYIQKKFNGVTHEAVMMPMK